MYHLRMFAIIQITVFHVEIQEFPLFLSHMKDIQVILPYFFILFTLIFPDLTKTTTLRSQLDGQLNENKVVKEVCKYCQFSIFAFLPATIKLMELNVFLCLNFCFGTIGLISVKQRI